MTEAGIEVCAPVHDAFLKILSPSRIPDEHVGRACELMTKAGSTVTGGTPIRTEAKIVPFPNVSIDVQGTEMWNLVPSKSLEFQNIKCSASQHGRRLNATPHHLIRNNIMIKQVELEVETNWSRQKKTKIQGRFLKGPIPMAYIARAAKLPGQALSVYLALQHQTALARRQWVTLPKGLLAQLGVSRDAKSRKRSGSYRRLRSFASSDRKVKQLG